MIMCIYSQLSGAKLDDLHHPSNSIVIAPRLPVFQHTEMLLEPNRKGSLMRLYMLVLAIVAIHVSCMSLIK